MVTNKKILVISPFASWPLTQGTIVRTHYFVKHLAQENKVWFAFRGNNAATAPEARWYSIPHLANRYWQLFHPGFFFQLWRLIRQEKVDLIVVSHVWSGLHGVLLKIITRKPLLFDNHNAEYLRFRRLQNPLWPLIALLEFVTCQLADWVVCVSEEDKAQLVNGLQILPAKIQVIPNGADVTRLTQTTVNPTAVKQSLGLESHEKMVLFFGSLNYPPNAQAVNIILDELLPRLTRQGFQGKWVIVGLGTAEYIQLRHRPVPENVIFAGFVADITAVIKSADLVIAPLLTGSGTRLKILESAACGRRIIATSIGAEGLDRAAFGEALTICDDWDAFSQEILHQLNCPPEVPVRPEFIALYDWDAIWHNLKMEG